jgi:predicted lipoprotein with Yx(FWY)xxD motif
MRPPLKILLPTLAVSLALAACGSSSNGSSSSSQAGTASSASASTAAVVKTASNAALGSTVLVNAQGMTLYHLSGESSDRFLCTSAACVASWPPLSAGAISTSIGGLAAVKRPDGSDQLAYKGEPLYTFAGDKAPGEANGQGVKADGGTWSAVVASASAAQSSSTSEPTKSYRGY